MKPAKNTDRSPPSLRRIYTFFARPQYFILLVTVLLLWKVIAMGQLVYGDIPYFDVAISKVNFLYAWGPEQLGTSVRQGFNTFRDQILASVSFSNTIFYFLKYVLPIILIPISYFFIFRKLAITNQFALIFASLFPLFTPVVFGDFISGQTFWIYLTIPWVLFFAIRIFCLHEFTLRNYLLLAFMLFLSLGMLPPIIVPLMVTVGIFVLLAFLFSEYSPGKARLAFHYVVGGVVTLVAFALLAAPYLLVASSGQQAYTPVSLLGDYYHNYSGTYFLNIFRLAGNNGNGQSTLGYNDISLLNLLGFVVFIATIIGAAVIIGVRKRYRERLTVLCLLATLLVILGFLDFLATSMDLGALIFQSQWVVSTIRNPSKLFTIILPIFTFLVAFCLQNAVEYLGKGWQRVAIGVTAVLVVGLYGWPALRGDLGLLYQREDALESYKKDPVVQEIAAKAPKDSRSLLMPAHHRDELNYQNINPGLNILRLEGGLPQTTNLIKQTANALNNRDDYFFNYITAAGVKDVFVKKDADAYGDALFSLFPVRLEPKKTKEFVQKRLQSSNHTNSYWHFKNEGANELVFSPRSITNIEGDHTLKTAAPFLQPNDAVVNDPKPGFGALTSTYQAKTDLAEGETIAHGKAQLHNPSLLLADLYVQTTGGVRYMVLEIINPLTHSTQDIHRRAIDPGAHSIFLDGEQYTLSEQKRRITLRADDYTLEAGTLEPVDIGSIDPSFESQSTPKAHDATPKQSGQADIYAEISNDAIDGKNSLLLGSNNHTAFVQKDLHLPDGSASYVLSFQHKNLEGEAPTMNILQDNSEILVDQSRLDHSNGWQTTEAYFWPQSNAKNSPLQLFLYTAGKPQQSSRNLLDNVRLYRVHLSDAGQLDLKNYPSDYELANYTHQTPPKTTNKNLLANASFEDAELWGGVGDATAGAGGIPRISAKQHRDAVDGKFSLELSSSNHTAFAAKTIKKFEANRVYKLSFFYKHIAGKNPSFGVWQHGVEIAQPAQKLDSKPGEWRYFETYFVPEKEASNLTVYLYSPSTGQKTINLFDEVTVKPASMVETYLKKISSPVRQPDDIVLESERINPTLVTVRARPGKSLLVFNESFHAGWRAYAISGTGKTFSLKDMSAIPKEGQEITDHVVVNDFANGWWVDSSAYNMTDDYTIVLVYTPQKTMLAGFMSTIGTATVIGGYIIYDNHRGRQTQRRWPWR